MTLRDVTRGALVGVLAVGVAVAVGVAMAWLLAALGLTDTGTSLLGPWLAGLGLLGGWQQTVTSDVAGGIQWATWSAGAPLLVTGSAAMTVAVLARRTRLGLAGVAGAAVGAGVGASALVALTPHTLTTTNVAGTVEVAEGLTWWWTGGLRPGTVTGSMALVLGAAVLSTLGDRWWRAGRGVAYAVIVVPGVLFTLVAAAGAAWLTSSPAAGVALAVLYPLLGSAAMLGLGGAPVEGGLTRITPEPVALSTWSSGPLVAAGGVVACLSLAMLVGFALRLRRHRGSLAAGVTATAALAAFVTWAMTTTIDVPTTLGGLTRLAANPLASALVAAAMAAVALAVRGSGRVAGSDAGRGAHSAQELDA